MAKRKNDANTANATSANVGYEAQLWQMADALRGSMDAAEYKHVVLGRIFLKYISDAFEEHYARLLAEKAKGADREDPDEYRAQSIVWVPPEARWQHLKAQARHSSRSVSSSTMPWPALSATTRRSRVCFPRTTPAPRSTRRASASSSI